MMAYPDTVVVSETWLEQAFQHDLAGINWDRIALILDVAFFQQQFLLVANRHAPFKNFRIKNSQSLVGNKQWPLARKAKSIKDWQRFRTLRFWKTIKVLQNKKVSDSPIFHDR